MLDLRPVSLKARRALSAEAERRARAGEAPMDIRVALGISKRAYSNWAKLFGFRQCDLFPNRAAPGAPPKYPPGPGGYAHSGRMFRGLPATEDDGRRVYDENHPSWRGGAAQSRERYSKLRSNRKSEAYEEVEAMGNARAVLEAVKAALESGDRDRADRLISAWKVKARRARDLAALEIQAADDLAARQNKPLSDHALAAEVSALLGRKVRAKKA